MSAGSRSLRYFWIAGILLLIGSFVGSRYILNNGASGSGVPSQSGEKSDPAVPNVVYNIGYMDMEKGVANLYPTQQGRILEICEEGIQVTKGQWLLKLDNRLASLKLEEAEALLKQAEKLPEQHKLKVEQQHAVIAAAKFQKKAAEQDLEVKTRIAKEIKEREPDKIVAQEMVNRAAKLIEIETSKLAELNLADPELDLKRARAVRAQAKLAVDECDLTAPYDGTVLRILVHPGEVLGSNPKFPAVQFVQHGKKIIRAEILQEWASKVQEGQTVEIVDDIYDGKKWTGTIKTLSPWFDKKRSLIFEPFQYNDVRTLECIIALNEQNAPLRIGQRVRVAIRTGP